MGCGTKVIWHMPRQKMKNVPKKLQASNNDIQKYNLFLIIIVNNNNDSDNNACNKNNDYNNTKSRQMSM